MSMLRFVAWSLPLLAALVHCAPGEAPECDDARAIFAGDVHPTPLPTVTDDKGAPLAVSKPQAHLSFEKGAGVQNVRFELPNATSDPTSNRYIQVAFPAGPQLLTTGVGVTVTAPTLAAFVYSAGCYANMNVPTTTAVILGSRGNIDAASHKIDGDFWRRIAVDIDWPNPGCTVGSVKGRVVFDITPETDKVNLVCDRDKYSISGPPQPAPADTGKPDAGGDGG